MMSAGFFRLIVALDEVLLLLAGTLPLPFAFFVLSHSVLQFFFEGAASGIEFPDTFSDALHELRNFLPAE